MASLDFTPLAQADLEHIGDYIAQDSPRRALSFIRELRDQCRRIAAAPLGYRERAEVAKHLRSCAYGQYVIFFRPHATGILIVRILHRAQDVQAQLAE